MTETQRERDRDIERDTERDRETDRDRQRDRDRERQRQTDGDREKGSFQKIYTATFCFFTVRCINVPTPNGTLALNPANQGDYNYHYWSTLTAAPNGKQTQLPPR